MTEMDKKVCREVIDRDGWHKFGIIEDDVYVLYWNMELEIMYEDMDGTARIGRAVYTANPGSSNYFSGTSSRIEGSRMANVFAWRPIQKSEG